MGRSKKNKSKASGENPQENILAHRNFLARALERNDTEIMALNELNKTLHKAKGAVVESCGDIVLLDLGSGRLTLLNDELIEDKREEEEGEESHHLSPAQKELCVDFLLRMKLRRKLLNRLARRLNRIAHAMDGQDVTPPPPPRYGDLSLHIDPAALAARTQHWKLQEEAKARLLEAKNDNPAESETKEEGASEKQETEESIEKVEEEDGKSEEAKTTESEEGKSEGKPKEETKKETAMVLDDVEILKEYDTAYEKVWDAKTNSFKYSILDKIVEPDFSSKNGVGAMSGMMSAEQREQEHKRWETSILARIPDQPSFEDLGMKNLVFCLEERRKRCLEEANQEVEKGTEPESKKSKITEDEGKPMDVDDKEKNSASENKGDSDNAKSAEAKSPSKTKKESVVEDEIKKEKSISLAAIPSFYDQDLRRIRLVHNDLLQSSIMDSSRELIATATNDYNRALQMSNRLYDQRSNAQNRLTVFIAKSRIEMNKINSDYARQFGNAKRAWLEQKQAHDAKRIKVAMPSNWGRVAVGTPKTQDRIKNGKGDVEILAGSCLADLVDASIMKAEGKLPATEQISPFVPPPPPAAPNGESLAQQHMRAEATMRQAYSVAVVNFNAGEEERKKAWKKLMKTRAELEAPARYNSGRRPDPNYYMRVSMPTLRGSTQQPIPTVDVSRVRAMYTPSRSTPSTSTSTSKYSIEKVRQRIAVDGTVAPVTEPKKTRDGLYQRPAGRTRKGMQWDAVRGIWVPDRTN